MPCYYAISKTGQLLSSIFHPYDRVRQQPKTSENGKYIFRLYFNGCWRKVVIDDRLPSSKGTRTLYVMDRNQPSLLWPALVEKAYLKTRGGYDFPGSNSGSDLWILTGWIPEQVFLHRFAQSYLHASATESLIWTDTATILNVTLYGTGC